MAKNY